MNINFGELAVVILACLVVALVDGFAVDRRAGRMFRVLMWAVVGLVAFGFHDQAYHNLNKALFALACAGLTTSALALFGLRWKSN